VGVEPNLLNPTGHESLTHVAAQTSACFASVPDPTTVGFCTNTVWRLNAGIKTNKLNAPKAQIMSSGALQDNFDDAVRPNASSQ
jgi:hypothetical protein